MFCPFLFIIENVTFKSGDLIPLGPKKVEKVSLRLSFVSYLARVHALIFL
jgi:hypothetical protein